MDVFGRMWENAAGLTELVSWSHRKAGGQGQSNRVCPW
jgi:hypothetical protein